MLDLVERYDVLAVIQIGVDRIRNNDQFLILAIEKFESIPAPGSRNEPSRRGS